MKSISNLVTSTDDDTPAYPCRLNYYMVNILSVEISLNFKWQCPDWNTGNSIFEFQLGSDKTTF